MRVIQIAHCQCSLSIKHHNCVNPGTFLAFFPNYAGVDIKYQTCLYKHTSCGLHFPEKTTAWEQAKLSRALIDFH